MIKTENIEHKICDLCGREVDHFASCGEYTLPVVRLNVEVYYVGHRIVNEICSKCNSKLYDLLYDNFEELKHLPVEK